MRIIAVTLVPVSILLMIQIPAEQELEWNSEQRIFQPDLRNSFEGKTDSLKSLYGLNKQIPRDYSLQCLIALSAFPELKNVTIEFELTSDGAPMESGFHIPSLLKPREKRRYKISLNEYDESILAPILLKNLPFDAQVAILVHELGHTKYYEQLTSIEIISWAIKYALFPSYRQSHEKSTDKLVIYRGFGHELLEYSLFVRYDPSTEDFHQRAKYFMSKFYLSPFEIQDYINKLYDHQ